MIVAILLYWCYISIVFPENPEINLTYYYILTARKYLVPLVYC